MFLVVDGIIRGLGRGQRAKRRSTQLNRKKIKFGMQEQKNTDEDSNATTTSSTCFEDDVDEEYAAMNKALGIHLILKKILSCLNPPELLQARLVSPIDWFDVATDILLRRRCLRIDFSYSNQIDRFISSHSSIRSDSFAELFDTLHKLTNCIRQSIKFPCVRFGLCGELDKREVKEFFDVYGSQVKELDLDLVFPVENPQLNPPLELENILLSQAPNMDGLHIKSVGNKSENGNPSLFDSSSSTPVKLPKLKRFILNEVVDRDLNIIQDIITAAVANFGFKCHFDFPTSFWIGDLDLFIQLNKLDTVRELHVSYPGKEPDSDSDGENIDPGIENPDEEENPIMELYRRFANTHHKLSVINLDDSNEGHFLNGVGFSELLPELFEYNRNTLKNIQNNHYLEFWDIFLPTWYYDDGWCTSNYEMEMDLSDGGKLIQGYDEYKPLLKKILGYLNTSELLDCRVVNKNWSHEASSILIERKSFQLYFVFSPEANRFILSRNQKENVELPMDFFVEDLPTLCNLSQRYPNYENTLFPCYRISVMKPMSDVAKSFPLHHLPFGLSELELICDFGPHTMAEEWNFVSDLLEKYRRQKTLILTNSKNYQSSTTTKSIVLPLSEFKSYFDEILRILNTDTLDCWVTDPDKFKIESYPSLLEELPSRLVSLLHLEFRPTGNNIELCQKIVESCTQLRSINIDLSAIYEEGESDNWRKVSSILSQILSNSSQTLKGIKGIDQLGFLPGLKLPQFPLIKDQKGGMELRNLKYPKVYQVFGIQDFTVSLLPRGFKFSNCFPFITNLNINYFPDGANIDRFHPNLDTATNVRRLTIGQNSSPITPVIFQKISRIFSELEFLCVTVNVEDFYKLSQNIWTKFPKLRELCILLIIGAHLEKQEYFPGIDAALTGYPQKFCYDRAGRPPKNAWKKYPSLTNLRALKSLHIFIEDFSRPEDPWNYLTRICSRGTFLEFPRNFPSVEVKTCYSNIERVQKALKWLNHRVKVSSYWPYNSKLLELMKPPSQ